MGNHDTDRIEKEIVLHAPPSRVWRALADAEEFGNWFRVNMNGNFAPGARVTGQITHPGYEHLTMDITIEKMEPERLISWRWHPNAIEPDTDYSGEPTTLVVFELEKVKQGTKLTVVESGFDRIPLARRAEAYRGNDEGWTIQMKQIEQYVADSGAR
ncbi:MAG: SRPBCC family protein [Gammaproteobacteria bacterium]